MDSNALSFLHRRRRDEVRQDFLKNRRSGEFGYHNNGGTPVGMTAAYQQQLQQHQDDTLDPRLEVRSDILLHRRRRRQDYIGDDWRSDGGGGRRFGAGDGVTGQRRFGGAADENVELTDFGLIDLPPFVSSSSMKSGEERNKRYPNSSNNTRSQAATTVRKGLLWVQKDRFFSRDQLLTLIHLTGVHKRLTLFYKHITLKIKCEKVL